MSHVDTCEDTPFNDGTHVDNCYDFNNYADAWQDCAGHSDSAPELCPGTFQGNFYVDNTECYDDTTHVNSYSHTPYTDSYAHTPFSDTYTDDAHINSYSHTPFSDS